MSMSRRNSALLAPFALLICFGVACGTLRAPYGAEHSARVAEATLTIPNRLSDSELWRLTSEMSEPGGYFQSDNFTSNEESFPDIAAVLEAGMEPGGVYLGVGPEQNFSYIAALRPKMAFIVDIRRQAVMQHLMYKALFELSSDRAEFISRLFSKPRPKGLDTASTIDQLWEGFWYVASDSTHWARNLAEVTTQLTKAHGFALTDEDLASLEYVYRAFYELGPIISYGGYQVRPGAGVTFADLTAAVDTAGTPRSFLATEKSFRYLRDMHQRNLIVPLVGDFGGPTAIRAVAEYVKQRGATVSAFYVSNVEQYLFRDTDTWRRFYANVHALPLDSTSTFIRPWAGPMRVVSVVYATASGSTIQVRRPMYAHSFTPMDGQPEEAGSSLCPMTAFLSAVAIGRVQTYDDVLKCPREDSRVLVVRR